MKAKSAEKSDCLYSISENKKKKWVFGLSSDSYVSNKDQLSLNPTTEMQPGLHIFTFVIKSYWATANEDLHSSPQTHYTYRRQCLG